MKVLQVSWFTGKSTVGVVVAETNEGERKAYIGTVPGYNEEADIQEVLNWGTALFPEQLATILEAVKPTMPS